MRARALLATLCWYACVPPASGDIATSGEPQAGTADAGFHAYSNTPPWAIDSTVQYPRLLSYLAMDTRVPVTEPEYDFVIIGGGTAGCVLARRLSKVSSWSVLLLEAGGEEPPTAHVPAFAKMLWNSTLDWGLTTVPDNGSCGGVGCHWPRGRVLGGCSVINHMVYVRGNKADFDLWEHLGNPGWGYDDVLSYFKKSEDNREEDDIERRLHGRSGPLKIERMRYADVNVGVIMQAFKEMGFRKGDVNGRTQERTVMRAQTFSFDGQRQSANSAFLQPIREKNLNLRVLTNAMVTRIIFDGKRAVAVEFTWNNEKIVRYVRIRRECIVSAGAISSPQILMLSGIGPKEHLQSLNISVIKDLKVGRNLQDHVSSSGIRYSLFETSQDRLMQRHDDYAEYMMSSRGPLSAIGATQVIAFGNCHAKEKGQAYAPAIQYMFDGCLQTPQLQMDLKETSSYYNEIIVRTVLMRPKSRGIIALASRNPYVKPLIFPNYFAEKSDVDALVKAHQFATNLGYTYSFQSLNIVLNTQPLPGCEHFLFNSTSYWECILQEYTQTIYHPVGTCKMGPYNDPDAVVDSKLNVHGVDNLRVIDASIMPTIVTGNTEASVLMIAEKGAAMIKSRWRHEKRENIERNNAFKYFIAK